MDRLIGKLGTALREDPNHWSSNNVMKLEVGLDRLIEDHGALRAERAEAAESEKEDEVDEVNRMIDYSDLVKAERETKELEAKIKKAEQELRELKKKRDELF